MRRPWTRPAARGFTLLEVVTVLAILAIVVNMIFVCLVRTERANELGIRGLERTLDAETTMLHLRRTIRSAGAVLPRHAEWTSGPDTLVLGAADGRVVVFTKREGRLAEIDPDRSAGRPLLHPVHASEITFGYGDVEPEKARFVTATFILDQVWQDTSDRVVLRTGASIRRAPEERP